MLSKYRKTITAVVTGAIGWAAAVVASAPASITASEWIMGATALATALGVFAVPNAPATEKAESRRAKRALVTNPPT